MTESTARSANLNTFLAELKADIGIKFADRQAESLPVAELLSLLYLEIMRHKPDNPAWPDRDRFILAQKNAWPAYACLLDRLGYPSSPSPIARPDLHFLAGVDFSSDTVGGGLSAGVGMCLALRLDSRPCRVFVLLDTLDLEAGRTWEAASQAGDRKLSRLCALVSRSGLAGSESTGAAVLDRFRSFGWDGISAAGHAIDELRYAFSKLPKSDNGRPFVIVTDSRMDSGRPVPEVSAVWDEFESGLGALGRRYPFLVLVRSAGRGGFAGHAPSHFSALFPDRVLQTPAFAANAVELAAGATCVGKVAVVAGTDADFSGRFWEDIRNFSRRARRNLTLVAVPDVRAAANPRPADLSILQIAPDIEIYAPANMNEACQMLEYSVTRHVLSYVRLPTRPAVLREASLPRFSPGIAVRLRDGVDAVFITCGESVSASVRAAERISADGIQAGVCHFGSIRPFDRKTVLDLARQTRNIITCEPQNPPAGLGSAVAETLGLSRSTVRHLRVALPPDAQDPKSSLDEEVQIILRETRDLLRPRPKSARG